ncbi:hypothetical protein BH23CHL2_BH23CHL2_21040 [soil metagenome]
MHPESIERFVHEWIETWNANDLEGLLAHYTDDAVFDSPRAQALTGSARVEGKEALRDYWGAAIARASSRRFVFDRYIWDAERSELVVLYTNRVDGTSTRACEVFHFDEAGLVDRAEALYGASQ